MGARLTQAGSLGAVLGFLAGGVLALLGHHSVLVRPRFSEGEHRNLILGDDNAAASAEVVTLPTQIHE